MNSTQSSESVDVVVVGAGMSGMAAAKSLLDHGSTFRVVEADGRVGGRAWSTDGPGGPLDQGAMFIGDTHSSLIELGESVGMRRELARPAGNMLFTLGDKPIVAPGGGLPEDGQFGKDVADSFALLDKVAQEVGRGAPWNSPRAAELDNMTVAEWMATNLHNAQVRAVHFAEVNNKLGAGPDEVSMLYWAYFVAQCDGIQALQTSANTYLWIGGAGTVAAKIGELLGSNLLLNWRVTEITHSDDGVTVHSNDRSIQARYAIIAAPLVATQRILFDPVLPPDRVQLQMRVPLGRMSKVNIRYQSRFWLDEGFSGEMLDGEIGMDCLDVTRSGDTVATLAAFIGGQNHDRWYALGPANRKNALIQLLVKAFGPEAAEPVHYNETHWSRQPFQIGVQTYMPTGVLSRYGTALREPIGNIHFAGTETAEQWAGYMEGAVIAGRQAAASVIARLVDR